MLNAEEKKNILAALDEIEERAQKDPAWLAASPAEDVHHFVEMQLVERLGPAAGRRRRRPCPGRAAARSRASYNFV